MLARQHQLAAILRRGGWTWRMLGRWSPPDGEHARRGAARVRVTVPAAGSLDFNERGTWSSVHVGPVEPPDVAAERELAAALSVTALGQDDLSPQGRLRAAALVAAGQRVEGAWLLGASDDGGEGAVHVGSGRQRGAAAPPPLSDAELAVARTHLPLPFAAPSHRDLGLAVLLARIAQPPPR